MTEQNQRPKGRPVGTGNEYSPLKFAEADEALRLILKRTTLPPHIHLRAAELTLPSEPVSHKYLWFVVVEAVGKLERVVCFPTFP